MPSAAIAPAQWTLPFWLGGVPTAFASLVVGVAGLGLAWAWTGDARSRNDAVRLALRSDKAPPPTIDPDTIPRPVWWRTTSGQLSAWAVAVERSSDGEARLAEVRSLVEDARHASPLSATSRYLVELPPEADQAENRPPDPIAIGRTRDVVTLAWTGRDLRRAGKIDAALKAFRTALELAGRSEGEEPAFDEARQPKRYTLAHENLLEWVAREMVASGDWTTDQWAAVLPDFAVAPLAAARVVQGRDQAEADRLLNRAIVAVDTPVAPGFDEAEHRAAGAEALAARSRWTDAADQYRRAIDVAVSDATRRGWWVNLAEVVGRSGDEPARAEALERAIVPGNDPDEITRRAMKARDRAGLGRTALASLKHLLSPDPIHPPEAYRDGDRPDLESPDAYAPVGPDGRDRPGSSLAAAPRPDAGRRGRSRRATDPGHRGGRGSWD